MLSRFIVRTVLFAITIVLMWTTWLTLTTDMFQEVGSRVALTIIESGVLLAALSLLIESFRSFGTIVVDRNSYKYFLFAHFVLDFEEEKSTVDVRTCEVFATRSVAMAMLGLMTAGFLIMLYQLGAWMILFFLNPYVPTVDWSEIAKGVLVFVAAASTALLVFGGYLLIYGYISDRHLLVRIIILGVYLSVSLGLVIGLLMIFSGDPIYTDMPAYQIILISIGTLFGTASSVWATIAIGFRLYRLVGKMSEKFPLLGNVWNQLCPIQKVHFVE